jgi:hypothetical protein
MNMSAWLVEWSSGRPSTKSTQGAIERTKGDDECRHHTMNQISKTTVCATVTPKGGESATPTPQERVEISLSTLAKKV